MSLTLDYLGLSFFCIWLSCGCFGAVILNLASIFHYSNSFGVILWPTQHFRFNVILVCHCIWPELTFKYSGGKLPVFQNIDRYLHWSKETFGNFGFYIFGLLTQWPRDLVFNDISWPLDSENVIFFSEVKSVFKNMLSMNKMAQILFFIKWTFKLSKTTSRRRCDVDVYLWTE